MSLKAMHNLVAMKRAPLGFTRSETGLTKNTHPEAKLSLTKEVRFAVQSDLQSIKDDCQKIYDRQDSLEKALASIEENFKALDLKITEKLAYFRSKLAEYDERFQKEAEDLAKKEDEILEAIQQEKARISQQILADAVKRKEIFEHKTKERQAEQTLLDLKRQELDEEEKSLQNEQNQVMAQLAKRREMK